MMYSPAVPDGTNASLDIAVSPDGQPEAGITYRVPPRCGVAVRVAVRAAVGGVVVMQDQGVPEVALEGAAVAVG